MLAKLTNIYAFFSIYSCIAPFTTPPDFNPRFDSQYGYVPVGWICLMFTVLYGVSSSKFSTQSHRSVLPPLFSTMWLSGTSAFPDDMRMLTYLSDLTAVHLSEALYFKIWWLLPTAVLAGIGEVLGWSARYWSSREDGVLQVPFLMQYVSPSLFCAGSLI